MNGRLEHAADVLLGYTPRRRSVREPLFRTLCDGGGYDRVAVTQGGAQGGRWVRLRCEQLVQRSLESGRGRGAHLFTPLPYETMGVPQTVVFGGLAGLAVSPTRAEPRGMMGG